LYMPNSASSVFIERGPGPSNLVYPSDPAVPINTWTHLGITFGAGTYNLYMNGVLKSSVSGSSYAVDYGGFQVGAFTGQYGLNGMLWEPAYYEVALTSSQMRDTFNSQCVSVSGCVQV
jgi:hypothetical protein